MNTSMLTRLGLPALAAVATSQFASAQNVIVNGDFESPVGGGMSAPLGSLGGWTASMDTVSIANASSIGVSGHSNQQVLDLGGSIGYAMGPKAQVYQNVFLNAGLHSFSFRWGQRLAESINSNYLQFYLGNGSQTLASGVMTPFPAGQPLWTYSTTVNALASGVFKVMFQENGGIQFPGHGVVVDDVQLNAVPEPATMLALAIGIGGLAARRGRRT